MTAATSAAPPCPRRDEGRGHRTLPPIRAAAAAVCGHQAGADDVGPFQRTPQTRRGGGLTAGRAGPMPGHRSPAAAEGSLLGRRRQPRSPNPSLTLLTSEKVTTNVNTVSTPVSPPVYDGDRTAALEVIPSSAGRPPRHLDIYGQLCWEFGADPRSSDFGTLPPHHRANAFPTRPTRSSRPTRTSTRPGPGASGARPRTPSPRSRSFGLRPRTPCPGGAARRS